MTGRGSRRAAALGTIQPDLAELCRIHEIGLDLIERSDDVDALLDHVLEEYERRLRELPAKALDARVGEPEQQSLKKLKALVMFATQAAALREKALASAELKTRNDLLEAANERLAAALRDAERARGRLDGVLEALGSGVVLLDVRGGMTRSNAAARALLGPLHGSELASALKDAVAPGGEGEMTLPVEGDGARTVLIARRPMREETGTEVVLITDITQRARDVEERVRLEKLAEVMRTLSVLSHKINNPLTALLGRAQILIARGGSDPHVLKAAAVIEESSQRIAELIRELAEVVREGKHEALQDLLAMPSEGGAKGR